MKSTVSLLVFVVHLGVLHIASSRAFSQDSTPFHFHPVGHDLEGLPASAEAQPLYGDDPASFWNQLHRLLFVAELIPEEIQAELPDERQRLERGPSETYAKQWYFEKRKGEREDKKHFGGDVRVSPR